MNGAVAVRIDCRTRVDGHFPECDLNPADELIDRDVPVIVAVAAAAADRSGARRVAANDDHRHAETRQQTEHFLACHKSSAPRAPPPSCRHGDYPGSGVGCRERPMYCAAVPETPGIPQLHAGI